MLPNGFSSAATITLAAIKAGYSVAFEPTAARQRQGTSKIRFARDGFKFWLILLRVVTIYSPLRVFVPISLVLLAAGVGYALWTIVTETDVTDTAALLITAQRSRLSDRPGFGSDRDAARGPPRTRPANASAAQTRRKAPRLAPAPPPPQELAPQNSLRCVLRRRLLARTS